MKIKVISKEFISSSNKIDVKSNFYDENDMPIVSTEDWGEYHLGQVSSSFGWVKQDCTYERYKKYLNKLYPEVNGNFEFEFYFVCL